MFHDLLVSFADDLTHEIVDAQNQIALIDRLLESDQVDMREQLALKADRAILQLQIHDFRVSLNVVKENLMPTRERGHEA